MCVNYFFIGKAGCPEKLFKEHLLAKKVHVAVKGLFFAIRKDPIQIIIYMTSMVVN